MKLSEIYGKQVCCHKGKNGYVIKIYADGEKITGFTCADENEREFYIPSGRIKNLAEAVVYEAGENVKPQDKEIKLGCRCYNTRGEFLGILRDLNCRGLTIKTAKIGAKTSPAKNLIMGEIIIVSPDIRALKTDVTKDGEVLFKSGETPDKRMIDRAISLGEYVQTNLKTL